MNVLSFGSSEEIDIAASVIVDLARAPKGSQYLQRAGLIQAVSGMFLSRDTKPRVRRALGLVQCMMTNIDAVDDFTEPAFLDAFGFCLSVSENIFRQ